MFDHTKLNPYYARILDRLLNAFPHETVYSLDNSEDYKLRGGLYYGAWVIEWLCPEGEYDWNVILLPTEQDELVLRWGGDHEHFGNWGREGDPEIDECLARIEDIFTERVWHFMFFRGDEKYGSGKFCRPAEVKRWARFFRATRYVTKSWRGTFDQEVHIDDEG